MICISVSDIFRAVLIKKLSSCSPEKSLKTVPFLYRFYPNFLRILYEFYTEDIAVSGNALWLVVIASALDNATRKHPYSLVNGIPSANPAVGEQAAARVTHKGSSFISNLIMP